MTGLHGLLQQSWIRVCRSGGERQIHQCLMAELRLAHHLRERATSAQFREHRLGHHAAVLDAHHRIAQCSTHRGESPGVKDILRGYRRLPAQWGAIILQYLATMPIYAMAGGLVVLSTVLFLFPKTLADTAPGVTVGAVAVGLILLAAALPIFVVATWLAIRLTFCVLPVIDPAMGGRGPVAAVSTAWRISKGHVLELIVLFLLVFVVAVVTAMCCGIPLFIIGLPTIFALLAAAWLLLMRLECPSAPELITRGPDGSWGLASRRVPAFDPSATAPPDFQA